MKGAQREGYLYLVRIGGYGLCSFCKYADWQGSSCCDAELYCDHPLPVLNEDEDLTCNVSSGSDCWGFTPTKTLQQIGVVIGISMEGNHPHTNRKGETVAIIPTEEDKSHYW